MPRRTTPDLMPTIWTLAAIREDNLLVQAAGKYKHGASFQDGGANGSCTQPLVNERAPPSLEGATFYHALGRRCRRWRKARGWERSKAERPAGAHACVLGEPGRVVWPGSRRIVRKSYKQINKNTQEQT